MSWVAVGVGVVGAGVSLYEYDQNKKSIAKDKANRPQYQIPDEIKQNLSQAQQQALQGLPAEQKAQYISNIQRSSAGALNQIGSRKGGLGGVAAVNENLNQGYSNLLSADAQARQQNQQQLMGARREMADYKTQSFQSNQLNPYYEGIAARNANQGALYQNINNSVGVMGSGISAGMASNQTQQNPYQAQTVGNYQYTPQTGGSGGGSFDFMNQQNRNMQNPNFNPSQYA